MDSCTAKEHLLPPYFWAASGAQLKSDNITNCVVAEQPAVLSLPWQGVSRGMAAMQLLADKSVLRSYAAQQKFWWLEMSWRGAYERRFWGTSERDYEAEQEL